MLKQLDDLELLSKKYNVAEVDIILIDLNICGINVEIEADRVRFNLKFLDRKEKYFCALQVRKDSDYSILDEKLYFKDRHIAMLYDFEIDFCDTYYMRRNNTVLNINPKTRINCEGCKFCYTSHQKSRNMLDLTITDNLNKFFDDWMEAYSKKDLSELYQIAVVSGCFPNETALINFLLELNEKVNSMKFHGEIFYLGSQIQTENAIRALSEIHRFAYSLSIECFTNREKFLRSSKSTFTLDQIKHVMHMSIKYGYRTNFTYILGLDSLYDLKVGLKVLRQYVNSFPIFNVFQEHVYQKGLRNHEANDIEYYLKARRLIEKIFESSCFKPNTWEVCRTLWYTTFNGTEL